ncbi:MAG: SAM-dependent methyltransferase, partial [Alphaproteobacteria bacterium]|nr:SAM-dependent methyltransferase [Alphaproteobacteria bacterium]
VVAPYMLTVVPEPQAVLDELARVLQPGGEIVLVNHVSGKDDAIALFEAWLDRHMAPKLGWRPQFPWSIIGDWIDRNPQMRLVERRPLAPFGLFTLTRIKRVSAESTGREKSAPLEAAFA